MLLQYRIFGTFLPYIPSLHPCWIETKSNNIKFPIDINILRRHIYIYDLYNTNIKERKTDAVMAHLLRYLRLTGLITFGRGKQMLIINAFRFTTHHRTYIYIRHMRGYDVIVYLCTCIRCECIYMCNALARLSHVYCVCIYVTMLYICECTRVFYH